mmetsp:Transcript_56143/g.89045  ORF Transcript_56143/g.89045 Transcript_56143/m.89045 type:complete len:1212 (+) Transcript_56143:127-3762(+)
MMRQIIKDQIRSSKISNGARHIEAVAGRQRGDSQASQELLDHTNPNDSMDSAPKSSARTALSNGTAPKKSIGKEEEDEESAEFGELFLDQFNISMIDASAIRGAWKLFVSKYASKEAAGEAIFQTIFEAAPSLQIMFSSARNVQAVKLLVGLDEIIKCLGDLDNLKMLAETLGFQHLQFDVNSARASIFRDALLDIVAIELGDKLRPEVREQLSLLLNYVMGKMIYVRKNYADRLRILSESWKFANDKIAMEHNLHTSEDSGSEDSGNLKKNTPSPHQIGTSGRSKWFKLLFNKGETSSSSSDSGSLHQSEEGSGEHETHKKKHGSASGRASKMPTSFLEMFRINSAVMGMTNTGWMDEVLEVFDNLVSHVTNTTRIQEESDVLALRLTVFEDTHGRGQVKLAEFKVCMLAALRSLLPKQWTTKHEDAWVWLWENVARMVSKSMARMFQKKNLVKFFQGKDEAQMYEMRKMIYASFFAAAPAGQQYFKQSNTRLHFIAERVLEMSQEVYDSPKKMVYYISGLGLRHVEFGIPTDLFQPFVTSCVEVLASLTDDTVAVDALQWSLTLISKILIRTINEGSTVVMKAINMNSMKQLKKAIESAPRKKRAAWLLDVQVGTQSISPLSWAIESGSLEVAGEIIRDLLTIRADRSNYYYGADELFTRHPDIIKRLVEDAPNLLPNVLDGLIWRSHRPENGKRRVNYYVKHMLINSKGNFSDALMWLTATGDPAIIVQPVCVLLSDTLWNEVVYRQFIISKMWNIFSLLVFMLSQGILPSYIKEGSLDEVTENQLYVAIFIGRLFTYVFGMGRLAYFHIARVWTWCRTTMKTIFEEIDQDGSGTIEWDEFLEASAAFKERVKGEFYKAFKFLRDDDGLATVDDARKAIATQNKSIYNIISFGLMVLLAVMLGNEPMLWCGRSPNWPTYDCEASRDLVYRYSIMSMAAMAIHWLILVDLAVFSTEISAFLLVVGHVTSEVKQFLTALGFLLLTFGSSIPIFCQDCSLVAGNYSTMPRAIVSLFAITLGWFEADNVMDIRDDDRVLLSALLVFVGLSVILLLNLLIAQLNRSYEYIYADMLGFARLNRASLIVEAMTNCGKKRWLQFRDSMSFEQKLEFDAGDLGLPGGVQRMEHQNLHVVLSDTIHRFGGSTSPDSPWPAEKDSAEDQEERFDRLELLLQKTLKRMQRVIADATVGASQADKYSVSSGFSSVGSMLSD